jgi:hypothetical protein
VLILGERAGIQLGLRQQRRSVPLINMTVQGLTVPTPSETLRIKAFLLQERRGTRDYIDVAALAKLLGDDQAVRALSYLNFLYPSPGGQTALTRLAEACESLPVDLGLVRLADYKGLAAPFTDWNYVAASCRSLGRQLLRAELRDELPPALDDGYFESEQPA